MSFRDHIKECPEGITVVLETPAGTAWYVSDLNRYVMELQRELPAGAEEDTVPSRELWTNRMEIVRTHLGGPAPGQQVDLFNEALAWGQ